MAYSRNYRSKPTPAPMPGIRSRQISIAFDDALIDRIDALAKKDDLCFSAEVRRLVRAAISHRPQPIGEGA